ncbi:Hypothetical protein A7982_11943 [Minicystis rosea]|nr:Hypothetical protein A7982_11943 [Minicystis rosea]
MPTQRDPEDPEGLDDELILPPPDADEEDEAEGDAEDELPAPIDEDGLDDAEADDLDVGGDDLETSDDELDEPDTEVDVGALDEGIVLDEESADEHEDTDHPDDDGLISDESGSDDDGGAEGTSEDPGDGIDEAALPELDDDDGSAPDDGLAETLLTEGDIAVPWAAARWAPLEGAGADVPCRAVAAEAGRVAAAGEVLLIIEEGARAPHRLAFGEGSVAIALGDDAVIAATARGQLLVARDGGADAAAIGSWRAGVESSLGLWPADAGHAVDLAATPGRFWIRAGAALLCATSPVQPLAAVRERGVLAITASGGVLVALTTGGSGPAIERFRGDDEGWAATPLAGIALRMAERARGAVRLASAAGGRAVALCDHQRIAVSRDGGATFTVVELGNVPAITFAGDSPDAPLLALMAPSPNAAAFVVEIDTAGEAARVGEIAVPERDGATEAPSPWTSASLAWDASRDVVWVASTAGLIALGRPQKH